VKLYYHFLFFREKALKGTKLAIIIEDSEGVRMKVAQWLNKKGYEVLHASNGEEGLQKIK